MLQRLDSGSATIPQPATTSAFAELVAGMNRRERRRRASRRRYRSSRRHYQGGTRRAVRRALAAGVMYLQSKDLTLREAAELCGSNVAYITAAVTILQT